jgi:predicted nucleic acid-binding protein
VIVLDTSGLLAAIDGSQRLHRAAADVLRTVPGPRVLSPFVLAELDYLLTRRVSTSAAAALLSEVATGAYRLEAFDQNDVSRAGEIIARYRDLEIGLTDASLIVLAERYRTWDLLTLDERHFRAATGPDGRAFRILPADA